MRKISALLQRILPPLWCGMVLAIGFLEAPLKFKAPGVTREIGLGIGKIVFSAMNSVEWVIAVLLVIALFTVSKSKVLRFVFGMLILILLVQTFWLIPDLINRANVIIAGGTLPSSSMHLIYVVAESAKVLLLLAFSVLANWRNETD